MSPVHGKNLVKVKQQNLQSVKTILYRYAPLSRVEIAERLDLTPPTITNIVAELIRQGVVRELPAVPNASTHSVGRKPINIDLVPEARFALGVSLGRDCTHYCITDLRGDVRVQGAFELMPEEYDDMVKRLLHILNTLKEKYLTEWNLLIGVGITMPGIVNPRTGVIKNMGNERVSWCGKPLAITVSRALGIPVRLENNVRARACAVSLFHPDLLGDESSFAFCHVFWGIACPVILDERSFRSETSTAGEIGKMIIVSDNAGCRELDFPGSLETISSVRAILSMCRDALDAGSCTVLSELCSDSSTLTFEQVLTAQTCGDKEVSRIIKRAMEFLGIALANVVSFLNLHLILLSGPIFRNSENFDTVRQSLEEHAFRSDDEKLQLIQVNLGEYGGAIGAAASCIEKYFLRG